MCRFIQPIPFDQNATQRDVGESRHRQGGCTEQGAASVRTGGGRGSLYCFALGN